MASSDRVMQSTRIIKPTSLTPTLPEVDTRVAMDTLVVVQGGHSGTGIVYLGGFDQKGSET